MGNGKTSASNLSDEEIVKLYHLRDEQAIKETDAKYSGYLFTVARNIIGDSEDAAECLNDTYLGAWNSIPPSKPKSLRAYLAVIMRRVAINRYHTKTKKSAVPSELTVSLTEISDYLGDGGGVDCEMDSRRLGEIISEFVKELSPRRKFIFIGRYYLAEPIDTIARELSLSRSSINKELAGIRDDLRHRLESEDYTL
ncbi:MAG: sigma-70 family RNA polymerase sigma factor [Clostridia bacterium]|nr:sigma-70 family RNA polymerase sigma factor [Clostridia bacterium]